MIRSLHVTSAFSLQMIRSLHVTSACSLQMIRSLHLSCLLKGASLLLPGHLSANNRDNVHEGRLPPSSLRLLVPPVRVMTAVMWKVVRLRRIPHYGMVEEFVSLVTEAVPDILTDRQMRLLTLGLRAKVTLQMLRSERSEDLAGVENLLKSLLTSSSKQVHPGNEAPVANFVRLVRRLLEDAKERDHFFMNVFPVEFGPDFDLALETLVCEFFTRLEELLLIPNFKQTAVWMSDTPSGLEEYMPCVYKEDDLKVLLRSKAHWGQMAGMDASVLSPSEQQLFSSLCRPPSLPDRTARDAETLQIQKESDEIPHQDAGNMATHDTTWPSEEETNTWCSSNAEQTIAETCGDQQHCDGTSAACDGAPATSAESLISSSSVIDAPQRRVAQKCAQCGKCFVYRYELLEHHRLHTGENPYKCSQCGKAYRRSSDLAYHRRKRCPKAAHICIKCGGSFQSMQERFKHQCCVPKFDCSQCGKSFKTKHLLSKHEVTHSQRRVFTCRRCRKAFPSITELRSHQRIHPADLSTPCTQCGKYFRSVASLAAHELQHRRQKTQVCVCCGKAFRNSHELNLHMRSHTGEKPFQCTYCGKRFSARGNLNVHIRIHTGEKPYLCTDCGKAFVSAGELQIHRRTHTGEKPYKCTVCGNGFTMASKLTVHMRVHTGERPFICFECGRGFSRGHELKKHTMTHTGVRPYACQQCEKAYTCHNHLKRHLKTHTVVQNQTV
uniref:C2H2-type domain-containing protein n=1 Tax=Gasterosteus aculeatus aculeatus TaxID=481459 RepID=A0AAQ4RN90_GASAC|nr:zinc finger protein ZFMSA12A isoform X2 [Gasterosteus aculeatus aculeatus]